MKRLTINRIASASLRTNKKSYIALVIGIFLSIFFVSCMVLGVHGLFMANEARRDARLGSQDAFWLDCEETDEVLMATGLYDAIGHVTIPAVHNDTSTSVGYYDDAAAAFLHRSFIEGRMPEKPGEIAIEESALARTRLDGISIGDTITLTLTPIQGVDETRSFTLVGILVDQSAGMEGYNTYYDHHDHFPAMLIHPEEPSFATGRLVQHKLFSFAPGVTGYSALRHYIRVDEEGHVWHGDLMVFDGYDSPTRYPNDLLTPNPEVILYSVCIGILAGTLLLATCVGIAGAMESQISRKRDQIGMLRAVGATKKQIRRIFGREALLLALIISPTAMAAGCIAAWMLSRIAPTLFLFKPTWWLLIPVLLLSVIVVLISGWLPLRRASQLMPMSVMRDTEMLRKLRHVRIKKAFRPTSVMAWRQLSIRPGRQIAPALLMALLMVVVSMTTFLIYDRITTVAASVLIERPSFYIAGRGGYSGTYYDRISGQQLTTGDIAQLRRLPGVKRIEVEAGISLLQEFDDEIPEYWKPVYYGMDHDGTYIAHNLGIGNPYMLSPDELPEGVHVRDRAAYNAMRQFLNVDGHLGEDLYLRVVVIDPEAIVPHVASGKIDLAAINAGEEVLVVAPTLYSFLSPDGALNTYRGSDSDSWVQHRMSEPGYTLLATIENDAYAPGQELTLHYVWSADTLPEDGTEADYVSCYEQMDYVKVNVRVGAVLDDGLAMGDSVVMLTTEQGLHAMGLPLNRVSSIDIYTDDLTLEEEAALEKRITSISMRGTDYTVTNGLAVRRESRQDDMMVFMLLLGVCLILLTVCVAQVTGSVSRRMRAEIRMIGTMRAVGADERVIFRIYGGQVAISVLLGTVVGLIAYWCVFRFLPYVGLMRFGMVNWFTLCVQLIFAAITLGASLLILRLRVRDVTRHSIVENIREL